jgi:transcription elongation factor GreB
LRTGKISWRSPIAQALMKAKVDDAVRVRTPSGVEELEIVGIRYGS